MTMAAAIQTSDKVAVCAANQAGLSCFPISCCSDIMYKSAIDAGIKGVKDADSTCIITCGASGVQSGLFVSFVFAVVALVTSF